MFFQDRHDAGRQLAARLEHLRDEKPYVIALPRGGVAVAYEIAKALQVPLDVLVVRKLGAPDQPELGFGAIAPNGVCVLNTDLMRIIRVTESDLQRIKGQEVREMERRLQQYRGDAPMPDIRNRTVILVDDGLATGYTALAAIRSLKTMQPKKIVLAVPVSAPETADWLRPEVDDLVAVALPFDFMAVGAWYRNFSQATDNEVIDLLQRNKAEIYSR